jgi:hypothetical protein
MTAMPMLGVPRKAGKLEQIAWLRLYRWRREMALTNAHIAPLIALIGGILILIKPELLSYIVAIYLIVVGLLGLNGIYHSVLIAWQRSMATAGPVIVHTLA